MPGALLPPHLGLSAKVGNGSLEEVNRIPVFRSSTAKHFGRIAPCYRELRDLDACVVCCVSRELERLSEGGCRLAVLDVGAGTGRYAEAVLSQYDDTLPPKTEEDMEVRKFFSEMKKREFQKVPSRHT